MDFTPCVPERQLRPHEPPADDTAPPLSTVSADQSFTILSVSQARNIHTYTHRHTDIHIK